MNKLPYITFLIISVSTSIISCANIDDINQALQDRIDELTPRVYSTTASRVYGQAGSFTTSSANNGGISADSLNTPWSAAVDSSGGLYVAELSNHRVLYFLSGTTTASRVYGQGDNFLSGSANNGGISADSLNSPAGVTTDSSGGLYVSDFSNNRVLYFTAGITTASRVYGQGGSFLSGTANNGGTVSAIGFDVPTGSALDSSGGLYVVENNNHRVLYFPSGTTTASRVYGQGGNFITKDANYPAGVVSADSLNLPIGVATDSSGGLYVADAGNNRVLYYPSGSTTATRVYGQAGSFTTNSPNMGSATPTADSLSSPGGIVVASDGGVYVADTSNHRVLYYTPGSTTSSRVYGQAGNFTTKDVNYPAGVVSADSLHNPYGMALDSIDGLYVADSDNHRVLYFY